MAQGWNRSQVARGFGRRGQVLGIGQAGRRVLGGEAGDVVGRAHRLLERRAREVRACWRCRGAGRRRRVTPTDLSRLRSTFSSSPLRTDTDRPDAFGDLDAGVAGAERRGPCARQSSTSCWNCSRGYGKAMRRRRWTRTLCRLGRGAWQGAATMITSDPLPTALPTRSAMPRAPDPRNAAAPTPDGDDAPSKTRLQAAVARAAGAGRGAGRAVRRAARAPRPARARCSTRCAQYRDTRSHEGRRRQMQYVGKLMREVDDAPLREAVAELQARLGPRHAAAAPGRALARRAAGRRRRR